MNKTKALAVYQIYKQILIDYKPNMEGTEGEKARWLTEQLPEIFSNKRFIRFCRAVGWIQKMVHGLGLCTLDETMLHTSDLDLEDMPVSDGNPCFKVKFYLSLVCQVCGKPIVRMSKVGKLPCVITNCIGMEFTFPGFNYDQLDRNNIDIRFVAGKVLFDYITQIFAVFLQPINLCVLHIDPERLALAVGMFRSAKWSVSKKGTYEERWKKHTANNTCCVYYEKHKDEFGDEDD